MKQTRHGILLFFTLLWLIGGAKAQDVTLTPTPLPTRSNNVLDLGSFPSDLSCPDMSDPIEGPSWGEIVVGSSSAEDLVTYAKKLGNYDNTSQWTDYISLNRSGSLRDVTGPPSLIEACLDAETEKVTALRISTKRLIFLEDLVAVYGVPDAVTWGSSNISRTVFWFEEGIAVSVYILEESEILNYGEIGLISYFPYQTGENFEKRWPYNHTNSKNPTGGDRIYDPPPSELQNPFDFEAMIATITAEPSRTPTPTFVPRSTESMATATP